MLEKSNLAHLLRMTVREDGSGPVQKETKSNEGEDINRTLRLECLRFLFSKKGTGFHFGFSIGRRGREKCVKSSVSYG